MASLGKSSLFLRVEVCLGYFDGFEGFWYLIQLNPPKASSTRLGVQVDQLKPAQTSNLQWFSLAGKAEIMSYSMTKSHIEKIHSV